MENLAAYLQKFKRLISSNEEKTKIISEEIFKITSIQIPTNDIVLREGTIIINTKPIIKSEVFIKKEKIIKAIKERGLTHLIDLR